METIVYYDDGSVMYRGKVDDSQNWTVGSTYRGYYPEFGGNTLEFKGTFKNGLRSYGTLFDPKGYILYHGGFYIDDANDAYFLRRIVYGLLYDFKNIF